MIRFIQQSEIGSWFESPMHPEKDDMTKFGYTLGTCPESERAAQEVVNLPTHLKITQKEARRVLDFLVKHAKPSKI
jgi:perosamine synthetase